MKRICSLSSSAADTPQSGQTVNGQEVPENSNAGENQSAQAPPVSGSGARDVQASLPPVLFSRSNEERTGKSIPGVLPDLLPFQSTLPDAGVEPASNTLHAASQPVLRASRGPGPTYDEPVAELKSQRSPTHGNESHLSTTASNAAYRSRLATWVESATRKHQAGHQEAARRITAFLEAQEEQSRRLCLSSLSLSTLPPLPADV